MKHATLLTWIGAAGIGLTLSGVSPAQQAAKEADALPYNEVKTSSEGVRYLMGGVGTEAQERFKQRADDFNLMLVFTLNEGNYIADVNVELQDAKGRTLVQDTADGPYFLAQVPPGRYTVSATYDGKTVKRNVQVGSRGARTAYLRWPSNPETDFIPGTRTAGSPAEGSAVGAGGQTR